jgi:hypothetical protein
MRTLGERFLRPLVDQLRPMIEGLENLPAAGPAVVLLNHTAANCLRDATVFLQRWAEHVGYDPRRLPGAVGLPRFFDLASVSSALRDSGLRGASPGSLRPSTEHQLGAVLQRGGIVLLYPENAADILGQGARRGPVIFQTGFVDLALAHGASLVPVACLSGENFSWNGGDWHDISHRLRVKVGAPLRLTLDPATATPHDRNHAAAAMRHLFTDMLHELHAAVPRTAAPAPAPFARAARGFPWAARFFQGAGPFDAGAPAPRPAGPFDAGAPAPRPAAPAAPSADASLARRVAALEAEGEVARAMFTWGRALDRVERTDDPADARHIADDLMTPDGVLDFGAVGWGVWGPDKAQLVAEMLKFSRKIGWAYHTYPNGEITVDLDQGTARYWTTTEMVPLTLDGEFQWYFLTQRTEFRKLDGAWKVARYTLSDLRVARAAPDAW